MNRRLAPLALTLLMFLPAVAPAQEGSDVAARIGAARARLVELSRPSGDARAVPTVVLHQNEVGEDFVLESISYRLDGRPILTWVDPNGALDTARALEMFHGRLQAGAHALSVQLTYRGTPMGPFQYLADTRFTVKAEYEVEATPGKAHEVRVVAFEREGFGLSLQERLGLRFEEILREDAGSTTEL